MRAKAIYIIVALLAIVSCSKEDDIQTSQREIQVEVVDMQAQQTRAMLINDSQEIIKQNEFALSAYLTDKKSPYFENECVFYFTPEGGGSSLWCFRDSEEQTNIVNFYWPADDNVNFVAYMPRNASDDTANGASVVKDIKYDNSGNVTFSAKLPTKITDKTAADREAENKKLEFVYAARKNQGKVGGDVKLRFVHPFAAVKFGLIQSHRDLTIHWIKFNNIVMSGDFSCGQDTYAPMDANPQNEGQSYLTHSRNWTPNENQTKGLTIELEKNVPDDINYDQLIGGPYLVMPQSLESVRMNVCFSWGDQYKNKVSNDIQVNTTAITAWQPGNEYTYYLDLGDNKEEILFEVTVEPWTKGEDSGYENNYDVK